MASTYLTRTFGTPTNNKIFTFSAWMKKSRIGGADGAFFSTGNASDPITTFRWNSDGKIYLFYLSSSSMVWEFATNALYRDCNGWYHVVIAFDSTESSGGDRLKLWINGEQVTSWSTQVNPSADMTPTMNSAVRHDVATNGPGGNYFDGLMSHVHFIDGTAYSASTFGSTDATTGEWKINTSPSVTYGDNGFFILKDGNSVTDQSDEGNNFTVGAGTLTNTEDNPSDVFCTWNPLGQKNSNMVFSNGNTHYNSTGTWIGANGTIGASAGKYYAEFKVTGTTGWGVGVTDVDSLAFDITNMSTGNSGYQSKYTGGKQIFLNGSTIVAMENDTTVVDNAGMGNTSFTSGDIVSVALDLTNNNLFFGKNGTWLRGATESEIEAGTSTNATFSGTSFNDKTWTFGATCENQNMSINAGNGYFGTTAISSEGTNASNIGKFEYDVPTGFTALSTKGLNE